MKKIEREIAIYCLTDREVSALTTQELQYIARHRMMHINYKHNPTNPLANKNGKIPRREIARLINIKRKGLVYPGDLKELTETVEYAELIRRLRIKIKAQNDIAEITKRNKEKRKQKEDAERQKREKIVKMLLESSKTDNSL